MKKTYAARRVCIPILTSCMLLGSVDSLQATPAGELSSIQSQMIKGTVCDVQGEPLIGVNVVLKDSNLGVITDIDGNFNLPASKGDLLIISYIGYQTVEITVGDERQLKIELKENSKALDEVVVVGYGTQKKVNLTGAVEQVGSEVFENRAVTNVSQGLVGAIPNLNINLLDGKPTQSPSFNVRGTTSIGQGGSALVLIDGVEGDPALLNPNDIESVSVLKDAASASIYGARAAFGVILISTKNPEKGKTSITYSANFTRKAPTTTPDYVTDGYIWAKHFAESYSAWNDYNNFPTKVNKTLAFSPEYLEELKRRSEDPSLPRYEVDLQSGEYVYYDNTDWYAELLKKSTFAQEHNVSVSGGNQTASFYVTGRYNSQEGLYRYNSDDYNMFNLRAKGNVQVYDWLRFDNNTEFSQMKYHNPINVGEGGGIWRNIADEGHPLAPMFNPDGTLTHSAAYTVGDFWYGKNGQDTKKRVVKNKAAFTADVLKKNLSVKADFTFQLTDKDEKQIRVPVPYSRTPGIVSYTGSDKNDIQLDNQTTNYLATNIYADYKTTFNERHNLNVIAGYNYEQSIWERSKVLRNGLIFEDASDINMALGQGITTTGGYQKWRIAGGFFRVNYNYKERYLLEVNGRYDGSSKFPTNQQYAFFPSVSAGWRVSEEAFWKVAPQLLSDLKLRASYGSLGNGNISPYSFTENFTISQSGMLLNGILPQYTSQPNVIPSGLTWETATTSNFGIDLGAFNGRLRMNGDFYIRDTRDMFTPGKTLPAIFGASVPKGNYADLRTTGWELSVSWKERTNLASKPLVYQVSFNLADSQSEITKYNNPDKKLSDYYEGMKIGEIWGYETMGFFQTEEEIKNAPSQNKIANSSGKKLLPGDIRFADLNNDNEISEGLNRVGNSGDKRIIGNSSARYTFGINLSGEWNGISLSAFFQGVGKQDWWPGAESKFWGQYNRPYNDLPSWHVGNMWNEENQDAYLPRLRGYVASGSDRELNVPQTKYLQNAAYVRLKNLQLGYTIPASLTRKAAMERVYLYVSGENLWTYSPMYKISRDTDVSAIYGSDRDVTSGTSGNGYNYPLLNSLSVGVAVTF